jgi:hypothetical protein
MNKAKTSQDGLYQRLRHELGNIWLVDAHEHLCTEEQWLAQENNAISSFLGYALTDLVCAGMPKEVLLSSAGADDQWEQTRSFWCYVRNTGAGSLCRRALSLFCDVEDLNDSTIAIVREKYANLREPGIYRQLLDEYNIAVCLNVWDPFEKDPASEYFAPLVYSAKCALVQKRSDIQMLERATNEEIYSLKTYLQALDTLLEQKLREGYVGIKWHVLAYLRDIHYPIEDAHSADKCLDRILRMPAQGGIASDTPVGFDEMRPFQNLIQHHLVQRAIDMDWPVQIHTGILGGSYGAQITHTNPTHLVDLFLRYPQARFDLLHASYPYMRELTALAKLFPNVYINMAWFDILSPRAARQYLREWITSVPINKIFAFGADQWNILLSCAYAEMVRDNLAEVLAEEVAEGGISEEYAVDIATCMLRQNAWEYFKLQDHWAGRQQRSIPN